MFHKEISAALANVRGVVKQNYDLAKLTFFKVGGPADFLYIPANAQELCQVIKRLPNHVPIFVIGAGSNLLIRDGGIRGLTIKLSQLNQISCHDDIIKVQSAVADKALAMFAQSNELSGLEYLYTIPGTVGGAVVMNAGAHSLEIKDSLINVEVLTPQGETATLTNSQCNFGYRQSVFSSNDHIILSASFKVKQGASKEEIQQRMLFLEQQRIKTQPLAKEKTGGSTFKNPHPHKAWKLISESIPVGLSVGGASVSPKHCNFLLNSNNATAKDIEDLGNLIIKKVEDKFNITLKWEIKIVGEH